jgi:hypothetical protein
MSVLNVIGWMFIVASWVIPYVMRKQATTFESKQKSYSVGMLLAAVALTLFIIKLVIDLKK